MTVRMEMNETHTPPTEVAVALGRAPELARREIELTLNRAGHRIAELTVASGVALVKAAPKPEKSWFTALGGATKFGRVGARVVPTVPAVAAAFNEASTVGFSTIGLSLDPTDLGRELKETGKARRYVVPIQGRELSAAQSKGVDREYLVVADGDDAVVVEIEAVQDIDAFTERDRSLPVVDPVRGMLPTKLARTMVNLGLGLVPDVERPVLLDPFCGTGRILLEAALLGTQVLGADIDSAAVDATQQNLAWASQRYSLALDPDIALATPVDKLPTLFSPAAVDLIVTEPYLGPPQRRMPSPEEIQVLFAELVPTYEQLFRAATHLLKPSGALVVVFPAFGTHSLRDRLVDRIEEFGYHALDTFRVERPDSIVARIITTFVRK